MLNAEKIKKHIKHQINLTVLASVDSTNHFLRKITKNNLIHCCFAEQQTQGKGRINKSWHSPFGKNIYFSCAYPFHKDVDQLAGLSLIVSLAIVNALKKVGITNGIKVKWPNDILCHNKKISGILTEIQHEAPKTTYAIIGIGLNVNMMPNDINEFDTPISQPWTSLCQEHNTLFDRNKIASILAESLLDYIQRFEQQGFLSFLDEWKSSDALEKKKITLKHHDHLISGKVLGINNQGHLLLEQEDGTVSVFLSGEVSILKS